MQKALILVLFILYSGVTFAQEFSLEGTPFMDVGEIKRVDPLLLYSIAVKSSARHVGDGNITPSVYAINSRYYGVFNKEKRESAEITLKTLLKYTDWINVGLMQINLHYHPQKDPYLLLDADHNISVGADILKKAMSSTADPVLGVGRYFSWREEEAIKYGKQVWTIYSNLKASQYASKNGPYEEIL